MGKPTASDPLGQEPTAGDLFQEGMRTMIRDEVQSIMRGKTGDRFDGIPDQVIAMELIARGWVAYKPAADLRKV